MSSCYDYYFFISKVSLRFDRYKISVANYNEYSRTEYVEYFKFITSQVSVSLSHVLIIY